MDVNSLLYRSQPVGICPSPNFIIILLRTSSPVKPSNFFSKPKGSCKHPLLPYKYHPTRKLIQIVWDSFRVPRLMALISSLFLNLSLQRRCNGGIICPRAGEVHLRGWILSGDLVHLIIVLQGLVLLILLLMREVM